MIEDTMRIINLNGDRITIRMACSGVKSCVNKNVLQELKPLPFNDYYFVGKIKLIGNSVELN